MPTINQQVLNCKQERSVMRGKSLIYVLCLALMGILFLSIAMVDKATAYPNMSADGKTCTPCHSGNKASSPAAPADDKQAPAKTTLPSAKPTQGDKAGTGQKATINVRGSDYQVESSVGNGTVLVSLRQVADLVGAKVQWDNKAKAAVVTSGTTRAVISAGKKSAMVNGKEVPLEVKVVKGRVMVPLSFAEELFGYQGSSFGQISEEWHKSSPPSVIVQWEQSKHGQKGIGCNACHGNDPNNIKKPSAGTCGSCHSKELEEFSRSTHATALEHAQSKAYSEYNGKKVEYKWLSYARGGAEKFGCENCHQIGYIAEDGTKGDCSSCHSSHLFSLEQARKPEACNVCHAGSGHPQYESYIDSTHGKLYVTLGNQWDWSGSSKEFLARQEKDPFPTPVCITCHMPKGTHNTRNGMAHDLYGKRVADYDRQVDLMVANCTGCHTEDKARTWLGYADGMARVTLARNAEAKKELEALKKEGLLRPTMEVTNSHPIAGQLSGVEKLFFEVGMAANRARKGAYHMSAKWAGRLGWTEQSFLLMEFRSEVDRLRREAELEKKLSEMEKQLAK
ncbi:hypothetical protein SY88_08380 [Clostridiales bacterium PH28_bin88]|nr:hypothetical protein SY88_08380 [Clostridiales bacterium PH28_bin88]